MAELLAVTPLFFTKIIVVKPLMVKIRTLTKMILITPKFILTLINSLKTTTFTYLYCENDQVYQYTCSAKAISGASRVTKGQNMKFVPAGWL